MTPRNRLLYLRILALRNVSTGYEPHQESIKYLSDLREWEITGRNAPDINHLAWTYRRQISPELVPFDVIVNAGPGGVR